MDEKNDGEIMILRPWTAFASALYYDQIKPLSKVLNLFDNHQKKTKKNKKNKTKKKKTKKKNKQNKREKNQNKTNKKKQKKTKTKQI